MIIDNPTISGSALLSGSLTITGSLNVSGSISGLTSNAVSASYALSSSFALNGTSASFANNASTASYVLNAVSASYALNASNALSSSYAATSSFANDLTVAGTITAQKLNVQQVTSSIIYSSGSNIFGNSLSNTQSMTGSVGISGSLSVNGVSTLTGALSGTSATFSSNLTLGGYLTGQGTNPGGLGASRYVVDFNSGNTRIFSYGANSSTAGGYLFYIQSSDGSISSTPLTIASTGLATFSSGINTGGVIGGSLSALPQFYINSLGANYGLLQNLNTTTWSIAYGTSANSLGTSVISWNTSGNVGIGTTSPGSFVEMSKSSNSGSGGSFPRLAIKNTLATQGDGSSTFNFADILISSGNETVNMFLSTTYAAGTWAPAAIINVSTNHALQIKTNNTLALTIASTGVATFTSSAAGLAGMNITNSSATSYGLDLIGGNATNFALRLRNYDASTTALTVTGTGVATFASSVTLSGAITNFGTGTGTYTRSVWYNDTSNQILFENARATDAADGTGRTVYFTWRGGPEVGGGVQLQHGANAWAAYTSDARMKTKVADVENGLSAIMQLEPIKFKWSRELENSRTVTGFTAQNVEQAIPDAVFNSWKDEKLGDVKSYYQDYLIPYLVKAIQELSAKITQLENK
jgi:hypothetical protein